VLNRCSAIITYILHIQETFSTFTEELKKAIDISWSAIALIEESSLYMLALFTEIGSAWQQGERLALKGSATEWVANHRRALVEPDLSAESKFETVRYHISQGIRSIAYLPLIARGEVIGSLIVASRQPDAYSQRQMMLLEQVAFQIAMPVENARLYAMVEEKARVDELTTLLNRRSMDETIAGEIGRHSRYGGAFSLVSIDLDSFKEYNDNYGHLGGDRVLKKVSVIIKGAVRSADQAFRYGGDEFSILLPQTTTDEASQVAERVRRYIALKFKTDNVPVTASIGIAGWPTDGITVNEIIAAADAALYQAKKSGGNSIHYATGIPLVAENLPEIEEIPRDNDTLSAIYSLVATVDMRNHQSTQHSKRVCEHAVSLARALKLKQTDVTRLEICATLHDIGKISISDEILKKPAKLSDDEWEIMKEHPRTGATIAGRIHKLAPCVPGILHHHERYDGSGYPDGLKGEEIPLDARILAIADAFTTMTSYRPYADILS